MNTKSNRVHEPKPAFKPDFGLYIRQNHEPAVFDPKKTAVLVSYHSRDHQRVREAIDPRDLGKGHGTS